MSTASMLYQMHRPRLIARLVRGGLDHHTAEDVVQDTFVTLHRRGQLAELALMPEDCQECRLNVCLRTAAHHHRRAQAQLKRGGCAPISLEELENPEASHVTYHTAARQHDLDWAAAEMNRLLNRFRSEADAKTWDQVAPGLLGDDVPRDACRVTLHRARRKLRALQPETTRELLAVLRAA